MSDYIKREDAISQLESLWDKIHDEDCLIDPDCELGINESIEVIKAIPSADVVEVRHGRWRDIGKAACQCSECDHLHLGNNAEETTKLYNYCPNCGARMDGEKE